MNLSSWRSKLICIFVVALLVRIAFILTMQDGFYFYDSVDYSKAAVNLITNGEFGEGYNRPPIYPVFLAGIYSIFGQTILAIRIVQALLGACLAIVIALMAKRVGGQGVGALAGILWSIYPLGVFIAGLVYPTTVATVVLACAVLCMVTKADQELGKGRIVLGGIFCGLAALTKPVVLVTVVFITLWIMYWRSTYRLYLATLFLLTVALALTPWTVRNAYVHGGIVIVDPRLVQLLPPIPNAQEDGEDNKEGNKITAMLKNPSVLANHVVSSFIHFWELYPQDVQMNWQPFREEMHAKDARVVRKTVFGTKWTTLISILSVGPMFFFALIGVGAIWVHEEQRRNLSLLCLMILSFAVGYAFFYTKTRYRIPIEPYILILGAYGLKHVYGMLLQPAQQRAVLSPQDSEASKVSPIS